MSPSLKLVLGMLAVGFAGAWVSAGVQRLQTQSRSETAARALTGGDPRTGNTTIQRYGCGACHTIKGVPRADGRTAASLDQIATQAFLAGHLPNRPEAMIAWIRTPQAIDPGNGMPDMGVGEKDARDMAAYLYTLR